MLVKYLECSLACSLENLSKDVTIVQTLNLISEKSHKAKMDAIRKKMQSLKSETDALYSTIQKFEDATKESNRQAEQVLLNLPLNCLPTKHVTSG